MHAKKPTPHRNQPEGYRHLLTMHDAKTFEDAVSQIIQTFGTKYLSSMKIIYGHRRHQQRGHSYHDEGFTAFIPVDFRSDR